MFDKSIQISSSGSSVWVSHGNNSILTPLASTIDQERLVASFVLLYSQARMDALDKLLDMRQINRSFIS